MFSWPVHDHVSRWLLFRYKFRIWGMELAPNFGPGLGNPLLNPRRKTISEARPQGRCALKQAHGPDGCSGFWAYGLGLRVA